MSKIRLDADDIKHIAFFESATGAKVKDFLKEGETACFVVETGDMGLAIGKKGAKVGNVRKALGKNILVFEYHPDPEQFIKNMFHPVELHGINIAKTPDTVTAQIHISVEDKSRAIGLGGVRIRLIRQLVSRHHKIDELTLRTV